LKLLFPLTRISIQRLTGQNTGEVAVERSGKAASQSVDTGVHPAWVAFIRYCERLGYGEIEKLKIQDGLPVIAEVTTQKVKFG
jgi:hypothetical protein